MTEGPSGRDWIEKTAPRITGYEAVRDVPDPVLTIAVIAYRSSRDLIECLQAVAVTAEATGQAVERMVVDCGGNEALRPEYKALCDTELVLVPDLPLNSARNVALARARSEIVFLVDDDGMLLPEAAPALLAYFKDPRVVAVRGRILFRRHRYLTALAGHYDRGPAVVEDTLAVEGHTGLRRHETLAAGGFDERLYGGEGLVLTWKLLRANPGTRVLYAPDVVMRHDYGRSLGHIAYKFRAYGGLRQVVVDLIEREEPGFAAYAAEDARRPKSRGRLAVDERIALAGLKVLGAAVRFSAACTGRRHAPDLLAASPRRTGSI